MMHKNILHAAIAAFAAMGLLFAPCLASGRRERTKPRIFAQTLVDQTLAKHPEVAGIEISLRSATGCSTIAASDATDIGEKCDRDELDPMKTGKPSVEEERDGFDITLPLHDLGGQVIGAVGMDFKPKKDFPRAVALEKADKIRQELDAQIPTPAKLVEPVP